MTFLQVYALYLMPFLIVAFGGCLLLGHRYLERRDARRRAQPHIPAE